MEELLRFLLSPTQWFPLLSELSSVQLVVALAISAGLVSMLIDWRLGLLALLVQYLLAGLLLAQETVPQLAMVKTLVGAFACIVLYWTGRTVSSHARRHSLENNLYGSVQDEIHPLGLSFRLIAMACWSLALTAVMNRFGLAVVSGPMASAAYWLVGFGLLTIILTRDPFRTGLGLLTIANGVEIVYLLFETALFNIGLLGIATILTALVTAYLTVIRYSTVVAQEALLAAAAAAEADPASPEALSKAAEALSIQPPRSALPELALEGLEEGLS